MNGVVTGIDRDQRLVHAVLDSGEEIDAGYLGTPPWPLAGALFTDEPEALCVGPLGDRRLVLHDDFMWGYDPGTNRWDGDGNWNSLVTTPTTGTGSISDLDDPDPGSAGVVDLAASGDSLTRIRKLDRAVYLPDDTAVWMATRISMNEDLRTGGGYFDIGLANLEYLDAGNASNGSTDPNSVGVNVRYNRTPNPWALRTRDGTDAQVTIIDYAAEPDADAWLWIDIVAVADSWAAFWVDGSGPFVTTAGVPGPANEALTPYARVAGTGGTGVTAHLYVDLIDLALVGPVNDPSNIEIA